MWGNGLFRLFLLNVLFLGQGWLLWGQTNPGSVPYARHSAETQPSIRLEPEGIVLAHPGASQHYIISAKDSKGTVTDVTHQCQVISSAPDIVEIDLENARIVGKSAGQAEVRVSWGKATQTSHITVSNRSHDMEISFSPEILSILTTKGCNGSGCHGSPAGQNGFKLSLFGYDAEADYQMIVKTHEGRRVNLQESGGKPHSPETFFYDSSRRWKSSSARFGRVSNPLKLAQAGGPAEHERRPPDEIGARPGQARARRQGASAAGCRHRPALGRHDSGHDPRSPLLH